VNSPPRLPGTRALPAVALASGRIPGARTLAAMGLASGLLLSACTSGPQGRPDTVTPVPALAPATDGPPADAGTAGTQEKAAAPPGAPRAC